MGTRTLSGVNSDSFSVKWKWTAAMCFVCYWLFIYRAPIDQPISRESSGDPNLRVIEQRIQCAITKITNTHSGTTRSSSSRGLDSFSTSPQWQSSCCNMSRLAWPLLTQVSPTRSPLPRRQLGSSDHRVEQRW